MCLDTLTSPRPPLMDAVDGYNTKYSGNPQWKPIDSSWLWSHISFDKKATPSRLSSRTNLPCNLPCNKCNIKFMTYLFSRDTIMVSMSVIFSFN